MPEMMEFYNKNNDFKEYCDRYAVKHRMLIENVLKCAIVRDVYIFYSQELHTS